jgi:hypothetical protein
VRGLVGEEGERESGAEGMSMFGRRSQTMSILSSVWFGCGIMLVVVIRDRRCE